MQTEKTIKKNSGITLVALIITIVLMLILVGVSVAVTLDEGLFDTARKAVDQTQIASDTKILTAAVIARIGVDAKVDFEDLNTNLPEGFENHDGIYISESGNKFVIMENGDVELKERLPEEAKVGDYVNYIPDAGTYKVAAEANGTGNTGYARTFSTEETRTQTKWRILSIDEKTERIELVAAEPEKTLVLTGADAYNHSVDILNDLCSELYGKEIRGVTVAKARSINVDDINAKTSYDYTKYEYGGYKYGQLVKLNVSDYYGWYPALYTFETGYAPEGIAQTGIGGSEGLKDGVINSKGEKEYKTATGYINNKKEGKNVNATYTYYYYMPENYLKDLGRNTAPKGLIKTAKSYWIASRSIYIYYGVDFSIRIMQSNGYLNHAALFNSQTYSNKNYITGNTGSFAIRPVVSLVSNFTLTKDTTNSTETTTYWNIEF